MWWAWVCLPLLLWRQVYTPISPVTFPTIAPKHNDRHLEAQFFFFLNLLSKTKSPLKFVIYRSHSQPIRHPVTYYAEGRATFSRWGSLSAHCLGNSRRQVSPISSNLLFSGFLSKGTTRGWARGLSRAWGLLGNGEKRKMVGKPAGRGCLWTSLSICAQSPVQPLLQMKWLDFQGESVIFCVLLLIYFCLICSNWEIPSEISITWKLHMLLPGLIKGSWGCVVLMYQQIQGRWHVLAKTWVSKWENGNCL